MLLPMIILFGVAIISGRARNNCHPYLSQQHQLQQPIFEPSTGDEEEQMAKG